MYSGKIVTVVKYLAIDILLITTGPLGNNIGIAVTKIVRIRYIGRNFKSINIRNKSILRR